MPGLPAALMRHRPDFDSDRRGLLDARGRSFEVGQSAAGLSSAGGRERRASTGPVAVRATAACPRHGCGSGLLTRTGCCSTARRTRWRPGSCRISDLPLREFLPPTGTWRHRFDFSSESSTDA